MRLKFLLEKIIALLLILILILPFSLCCLLSLVFIGRPLFFIQKRIGQNEQAFDVFKLRTLNPEGTIPLWGKILRILKIDEFPQLLNILRGDMSFVGPRPLLPEYLEHYSTEERKRHQVRPGLTGLVQISGGNNLSWKEKFKLDLEYVEKQSLFFDMTIICKTLFYFFSGSFLKNEGTIAEKYKGE